MTFLARIGRFLFWLLVVSWGMWLLRRVFGSLAQTAGSTSQQNGAGSSSSTQAAGGSRRLVRDPVCGMHVDETLSIPLREGDEIMHFCSLACRDAHIAGARKFAAHG